VDPDRDSPQVLARYIKSFDPEFRGYTGAFDNIASIATQLNVAFGKVPGPELGTYSVEHSASIIVINPDGKYAGFIKAPHQPQNIRAIVNTFK
jgi:protein SCO1/2